MPGQSLALISAGPVTDPGGIQATSLLLSGPGSFTLTGLNNARTPNGATILVSLLSGSNYLLGSSASVTATIRQRHQIIVVGAGSGSEVKVYAADTGALKVVLTRGGDLAKPRPSVSARAASQPAKRGMSTPPRLI